MNHEWNQPEIFKGRLKSYQLKGMNWLANLYDQGINGILADEMGLGKTVQSIAFLAHLSESHGIWGPFLIIAPASTLHNWQQEVTRFVPDFKVIPYWGSTQDRKVLRKFWSGSNKESAFHVVITSYQLVVQDSKYFQQINWHYMILDEAQAIKSSNSSRWKSLLVFKCRNRLLLTGTPIQNSMAELWSLLHFIMPTLFDSHEEFNEWFSKDIESHVEKQSSLDTTQLSRLHMILKPFMLRRVKKDVENELSDKIEIKLACPLTNRQKLLYRAIKNKISIDDLLQSSSSSSLPSSGTLASNLMNIVMQLRKVCNHPELFERREVKSPLFICIPAYQMPKLMYREAYAESLSSNKDWLKKKMTIFDCLHIHRSLFNKSKDKHVRSCFSFTRFMNMSPADLTALHRMGFFARWHHYLLLLKIHSVLHYRRFIFPNASSSSSLFFIELNMATSSASLQFSPHLLNLCFTSPINSIYAHCDNVIHFTRETPEHRKCSYNFQKVLSTGSQTWYAVDRSSQYHQMRNVDACYNRQQYNILWNGLPQLSSEFLNDIFVNTSAPGGLMGSTPQPQGYSKISIPSKETLIRDAGKLQVLDKLLTELKMNNHRVLIYSQMTRMIDLLEEFLWHRRHTYIRLDGSSKISERRDMVADFQSREDIFAFLLSTRAGGLGINLTAADTVIFYDSDWNPTVDQQAMDRAHRLGQTKQVTVYRLICEGTIEERILQRALEKSEIQRMVISGGNFAPDVLKPKEVVTLLLDDDDMDRQSRCGGMTKEGSSNSSHSSINSLQQQKKRTRGRPGRPKKIIPPNEVSVVGRSDKEGEGDNKIKSNKIKKAANISVAHAPRSTNATPQLTDDTSMMSASSFVSMPASPRSEISCTSFDIPQSESVIEEESSDSTMLVVDDPHQLPYTTLTSVNPPLKKRGRPKGSVLSRPRGRTGIQRSLCAAELAAVQAAKKATFAAHGYTYTADIPPSFLSKPTTNNNISTNHLNI
ncbi:hypothetical protein HELRODRAFT_106049 [Helobdella robusta]|uniref:Chromatin-remodeling ATPase INO80 n=1 Tax=Helobdella robusta TaxID=6412 RepID=T1EDZ6_HELRO|nr:hypothetical protein HELRODRAFT_106049 [Helobdella robusta]ESO06198.1 hypothetical protein HELRODRAFT_106049 [Helobdella robusta]